jgi:indolepyruvate ferredoxin oxidoreductase alpha subunit
MAKDKRFYDSGKFLMIGNEGIVRGCLEVGINFLAAYPGTPTTDISETFSDLLAADPSLGEFITQHWAINEAVAISQAAGAAWTGARALAPMKHVGVNVASDALSVITLNGPNPGSLVLVVGSDPGSLGSHQEQNERFYGWMFNIPIIEPQTPQDCHDWIKIAFNISQKHDIPIYFRTSTRSAHSRGFVNVDSIHLQKGNQTFVRDIPKYCSLPPHAINNHIRLYQRLEAVQKEIPSLNINSVLPGDKKTGIITSGIPYGYTLEALNALNLNDVPIMKLGMIHPLDNGQIRDFAKDLDRVIIVEELEPFLEMKIGEILHKERVRAEVIGSQYFPKYGEYSTGLVASSLAKIFDISTSGIAGKVNQAQAHFAQYAPIIPKRFPTFCAGCPERATVYAIRKVTDEIPNTVVAGDIGCYVMSFFPPMETSDFIICMSGGLSAAIGIATQTKQNIIALIGDSTFLHTGMAPLADAVANNSNITLIVFENNWVAMTGGQPVLGLTDGKLSIETIAQAIGAKWVRVADPYKVEATIELIRKASIESGIKVIIIKRECMLQRSRTRTREIRRLEAQGKEVRKVSYTIEACRLCGECFEKLACVAIRRTKDENNDTVMQIDEDRCNLCSVCYQLCPNNAVKKNIHNVCGEDVKI